MMWQVGAACYGTEVAAVQSIASEVSGTVRETPSGLYGVSVSDVVSNGYTVTLTPLDGGPSLPSVFAPVSLQPCNLLDTADAVELGWLLMGTWVAVYCVKFLARALRPAWGGSESDA